MLSSRPSAPVAVYLSVSGEPADTWNNRPVPPMAPYPGDVNALYEIVKGAWKSWNVSVTTSLPTVPHLRVVIGTAWGNWPGGGQSNINSFKTDANPTSYVFADRVGYDPVMCGWLAAHESGHGLGGFSDCMSLQNGVIDYTPGLIMGNCLLPSPQWTPDHRQALDAAFGPQSDLDFSGTVDYADAMLLQQGGYTASEAINLARNYGKKA